ncbi:hypothetical protein [Actinocorallia longicatena]|uniref:Secreted protein with PEP-CTERM sorting signal n=1 Tax=Actinocorallia longicatena TaxID=111803 RepID=A0ABP6QCX3_9ACTN
MKRVLLWLGTLLGLVFGALLILGAATDNGDRSLPFRLAAAALGLYLLWSMGRGVLRLLRS